MRLAKKGQVSAASDFHLISQLHNRDIHGHAMPQKELYNVGSGEPIAQLTA